MSETINNEHKNEMELIETPTTPNSQGVKVVPPQDHFTKISEQIHSEMSSPRPSQDLNSPRVSHDTSHPTDPMINGNSKTKKTKSFRDLEKVSHLYTKSKAVEDAVDHELHVVDTVYHKFKERDRSDSLIGATFNFVNSTVGASTLSLPYVIYSCGILFGVPFILLGAIFGYITLSYLYIAHQYALERDPNIKDYENIGYLAYGWLMSTLIKLCIIAFSFAGLIGYVIIISDFTIPIWRTLAGNNTIMSQRWLSALIVIVPLFLISQVKRMGDLRWISYLSVSCIVIFVGFVIISYATGSTNPQKIGDIIWVRVDIKMFKVIGIIIFAFACHTMVAPINYEFKKTNRHRVGFSIYMGVLFSSIFFLMTAIFGYLCFLDNTNGNLLRSFFYSQDTWYNQVFAAIFTLNIFVCYPMVCFPLKLSLDNLISPLWRWKFPLGAKPYVPQAFQKYEITKDIYLYFYDSMESIRYFFITFFICFVSYICGVFIPNIDVIFSIVGSSAGALIAYIIPIMLYIKLAKHPWKDWRIIISIIALILSILAGIFVTIISILGAAGVV